MPALPRSRRRLPPLVLLAAVLVLAGCDGPDLDNSPPPASTPEVSRLVGEAMVRQRGSSGEPAEAAAEAPEARIEERRRYSLQFDAAEPLVSAYRETHEACVAMRGCQVEQGRLETPRHGLASGTLAIRVARDRMAEAEPVRRIEASPALSGVEITREDRTQQMIDIEARLAQQIVLRERLKVLAREGRDASEQAIDDLLQVERELARVQGEIESMQGRQRHLSRVTDSVAITASFQQQRWVDPHQHGVLAPLWRALDRSTTLFFESVGQVILVVVFLTPWLVLGLPALWLLTRLWRWMRRGVARLVARRKRAKE